MSSAARSSAARSSAARSSAARSSARSVVARSATVAASAGALMAGALMTTALTSCAMSEAGGGLLPPFDATHDAAIDIRADGCGPRIGVGSGSMIDDRLAVTAAHVVAGSRRIDVHDSSGVATTAEVVSFDPDLDLAVLRTAEAVGAPVRVRPEQAAAGEVGVVALPRRETTPVETEIVEVRVLRAVNIRTTDIYLDNAVERAGFEIAATIDPGDSGSTVVIHGGAVGVIWARSNERDERAWAVDLPPELADPAFRAELVDPATPAADVGDCIRGGQSG